MEGTFQLVTAFLFGSVIGSFLNVCIYRIPLEESVVAPRSKCPGCGTLIRAYDNIPILSYILLRGRCRNCGLRISPVYPLVELMGGLAAVAALLRVGALPSAVVLFAFLASLIVVTFIDLRYMIIPDVISLPGIVLGFASSFIRPEIGWLDSLVGIGLGGGVLFAVVYGYRAIFKRDGMGLGDVKLLAMIGAFLGWHSVFFALLFGSLVGSLVGVSMMIVKGKGWKYAIPFGPFLALGAVVYLFSGPEIIGWYFGLM